MAAGYEIDYIVGPESNKIFGIRRYQGEIHSRLSDARLNVIGYRQPSSKPLSILMRFLFPFYVMLKSSQKRPKHITNQALAHLLLLPGMSNSIVTIYDTVFLERPSDFSPLARLFMNLNMWAARRAKKIITISSHSAIQIQVRLGIPTERIAIILPGIDAAKFRRAAPEREVWAPGRAPIVLYLGSEDPRQNVDKIILAVASLRRDFPKIIFLKAGSPQWNGGREKLVSQIGALGLSNCVKFLDYVADDKLPSLYSSADVFVYPCSSTGWGLPPAEALACQVPVVTSLAPPLPEVVGGGALLVNPESPEEIASAIRRVLSDPALRKSLREKGNLHLKTLDWEIAAKQTGEAYKSLIG